jgi:hypothetical protein
MIRVNSFRAPSDDTHFVDVSSVGIDHKFVPEIRRDTSAPQGKETEVNRLLAFALLTSSSVVFAQVPQLKSGSTIYIEPMGGYETYLAAGMVKKHVPLVVVADKNKADFIITSHVSQEMPNQPAVVVNNSNVNNNAVNSTNVNNGSNDAWNQGWELGRQRAANRAALGSTSASFAVVDPRSSQIVFAYSADKAGANQLQRAAEACAKRLKEFIEKSEKSKK